MIKRWNLIVKKSVSNYGSRMRVERMGKKPFLKEILAENIPELKKVNPRIYDAQ